jgi:uncharacterized protein (TIGR03083 family)
MNPTSVPQDAAQIPYTTADEACALMQTALERLLRLLKTLDAADWVRPTACALWNVQEVVAHQAGGYASGTGYREMFRQYLVLPQPGRLPEDDINARQVAERAGKSPAELIAELESVGPTAIQKWAYEFRLIKRLTIPHPLAGGLCFRDVMWITHSRDTWMHRLDICRATERPFEQTPEHDGRIVALVMRDVEKALRGKLARPVEFNLTGAAGGAWKVGAGPAAASIQMDALDFNIFASGRFNSNEARARATISGETTLAEHALRNILILY